MRIKNSLMLLLTATIWGVAFVAQSVGLQYVGPFTFNCVRSIIGGIVLIPCIFILKKIKNKNSTQPVVNQNRKTLIIGGVLCGIALFVSCSLQQKGLLYTTAGKAGFITAFYIIIVPILGLFLKKKCPVNVWIGVVLAIIGLYFLCIKEGFSIGRGDFLIFLCAITFAIHILVIDHYSPLADGVVLSCIQFFVAGILSGICMLLFEKPHGTQILSAWLPILYAGALSCGVAYTLQIVAQKDMNPAVASIIMSLESVISVLASWVILGQVLSRRELVGCLLMFCAVILVQINPFLKKRKNTSQQKINTSHTN